MSAIKNPDLTNEKNIEEQFRQIQNIISSRRMYYMKSIGSRKIREFVPEDKQLIIYLWHEAQSAPQAQNLSENCMICLMHMDKETERLWTCSGCQKSFHHECTSDWVQTCRQHNGTPTCPNCRRAILLFDKTLRDNSSERVHPKLYNLADNTVTINGQTEPLMEETPEDRSKAINPILEEILKKAYRQDLNTLQQIKKCLDNNGINSINVQEKIDSIKSCCIS